MLALGVSTIYYLASLYQYGWLIQEKQNNRSEYFKQKQPREGKANTQSAKGFMLTVACFLLIALAWLAGESEQNQNTQKQQNTERTSTHIIM